MSPMAPTINTFFCNTTKESTDADTDKPVSDRVKNENSEGKVKKSRKLKKVSDVVEVLDSGSKVVAPANANPSDDAAMTEAAQAEEAEHTQAGKPQASSAFAAMMKASSAKSKSQKDEAAATQKPNGKHEEGAEKTKPSNAFAAMMKASSGSAAEATSTGKAIKEKKQPTATTEKPDANNADSMFGVGDGALTMAAELIAYDVDKHAQEITLTPEGRLPYSALTATLETIGNESKRLLIVRYLTNFFRVVLHKCPHALLDVLYLCVNKVAPDYAGLELGIGDATLITALASTTGKKESSIKSQYDEVGDLGLVALKAKSSQKSLGSFFGGAASAKKPPLTCHDIFSAFVSIAKEEGGNSKSRRIDSIRKMLVRAQNDEAGWIVRGLQGKLRIGLAENSVLAALGQACCMHEIDMRRETSKITGEKPEKLDTAKVLMPHLVAANEAIRTVYSECPNYGKIVDTMLAPVLAYRAWRDAGASEPPTWQEVPGGMADVRRLCSFEPGVPVHPMLSKPTKGVQEILTRFNAETEFQCEYKYDGERTQIHVFLQKRGSHKRKSDASAAAPAVAAAAPASKKSAAAGFFAPRASPSKAAAAAAAATTATAETGAAASETEIEACASAAAEPDTSATYERVVKIYSRNSEDMTTRYPDVTVLVDQFLPPAPSAPLQGTPDSYADASEVDDAVCESIVIDAESVAFDRETKTILPFQNLMNRKKKDVKLEDVKVNVCVFAFDILYYNGVPLLKKPLRERREILAKVCKEIPNMFQLSSVMVSREFDDINNFLNESVGASTEGLIIKTLDDTYEPSRRSLNWLKLKKDYIEDGGGEGGLGDSVDLVPIAAWHGKGKRTGVYGAYLLACYNPETESYESCCKIGTGFSEEVLESHTKALQETEIQWSGTGAPRSYLLVGDMLKPDIWLEPTQVWEVKAADLSLSPTHKAAIGVADEHRGVALRFPRFLRIREDKKPDEATTNAQISEMYWGQESVQKKDVVVDDEDEMML